VLDVRQKNEMKDLFSPFGTSDLVEWWVAVILANIVTTIWAFIFTFTQVFRNDLLHLIVFALAAIPIALGWTVIAVTIRRLRDRGRPAWTVVFGFIPVAGWIWLLIECGFLPSRTPDTEHSRKPNKSEMPTP
jgi:uncharacterized membrane protein YhaH (DUF805 family)